MAVIGSPAYSPYTDAKSVSFNVSIRDAVGIYSATTWYAAGTTGFDERISRRGARNNSVISENNFASIVSVTGSGMLGAIYMPKLNNDNAAVWTIEITLDGVVTERVTPAITGFYSTNRTLLLNAPNYGTGYTYNYNSSPGGYNMVTDSYYQLNGAISYPYRGNQYTALVPADLQHARGAPVLHFSESMQVRYKFSGVNQTRSENYNSAGALYVLNP